MGKYGTNLEGFGAFEGGVNADKGAPLVSTSSDGETALLFGPAALREIQAGVANGDFAIPPDAAGDTITAENPLPYWTFTDVNSAGAITCAIVTDINTGSTNVLKWTVASGTLTGKSAKITRYVPVPSTLSRSFSYYLEASFTDATNSGQADVEVSGAFYKTDLTISTGSFDSGTVPFSSLTSTTGVTAPASFDAGSLLSTTAPSDAAYLLVTITISTNATQSADRTIELAEVNLFHGSPELLLTDRSAPQTHQPAVLQADAGELLIQASGGNSLTITATNSNFNNSVTTTGDLTVDGTTQLNGANSLWVSRASVASAAQSLTNNTSTKILLDTASATPTTGTYDPQSWFVNASDHIAVGQDGFYCVTANIAFVANATGRRRLAIEVNGSEVTGISVLAAPAGATNLSTSTNLYLAAGDLVTMTAIQASGGALSTTVVAGVYPALSVGRIGA